MRIRAFSSAVQNFLKFEPKRKLPPLDPSDTDRDITDIKPFFEYIMETSDPCTTVPDRLLLGQSNLRKLAILYFLIRSNKPEDAKVLQTAFWTYCGHKAWPSNNTIEMIIQAMINIDAPVDASDKALHNNSLWAPIRDVFKLVEISTLPKRNEQTYLMGINAAVELKDMKWARRFHARGAEKMSYSDEFNEAIESLRANLSEEELKDFRIGKKDKQ